MNLGLVAEVATVANRDPARDPSRTLSLTLCNEIIGTVFI